MTSESGETETVEEAPRGRLGSLPAIVGSVLLVIALLVSVVGGVVSYRSAKALRTELATVKKEIKELKDLGQQKVPEDNNAAALEAALKDMKLQVETLTKQIGALMASVAAHSVPEESAGKAAVTDGKPPAAGEGGPVSQKHGKQPNATEPTKSSEVAAKKNDVRNCDLIGKSPGEQAAILKRCVSLIDPPNEKGAPPP